VNSSLARLRLECSLQTIEAMMSSARWLAISVLALVACRDAKGKQPEPAPGPVLPKIADGGVEKLEAQSPNAGVEGLPKTKDGT
jgi:hypothetical protein